MKFNLSYPVTGLQKKIEIDDDKKVRHLYDKKMGQEIDGELLGDEYKGYIFRISGGNDKQGFPMKQGVLVNGRVRLLMKKKTSTYRPSRKGERKRKSVRGCIVGPDMAVVALRIEKKGEQEIEGVTDGEKPRRRGPKRANHIRKVFALRKQDDVRKYVVRREIKKGDKTFYKSPKIQRLITETRLRRKRLYKKSKQDRFKKSKEERAKYEKLLSSILKERKALHKQQHQPADKAPKQVAESKQEAKGKPKAQQQPVAQQQKKPEKVAKGVEKSQAKQQPPAKKK